MKKQKIKTLFAKDKGWSLAQNLLTATAAMVQQISWFIEVYFWKSPFTLPKNKRSLDNGEPSTRVATIWVKGKQ